MKMLLHLFLFSHILFDLDAYDKTKDTSSCVSLAHGPRWLFLLSRHRKAFLLLLIRSLL